MRNDNHESMFNIETGTANLIDHFVAHISQLLGPIACVIHSNKVAALHIDVHVVAATKENPWQTLITSGMSDLPMHLPDDSTESPYAELMLCLPASWPITQASIKSLEYAWPVHYLQRIAMFPHQCATFLDEGHTVRNGGPLGPNTELTACLVLPPLGRDVPNLTIGKKTIKFLQIVLIHEDEVGYAKFHGSERLWTTMCNAFEANGYEFEICYQPGRPSAIALGLERVTERYSYEVMDRIRKTQNMTPEEMESYFRANPSPSRYRLER